MAKKVSLPAISCIQASIVEAVTPEAVTPEAVASKEDNTRVLYVVDLPMGSHITDETLITPKWGGFVRWFAKTEVDAYSADPETGIITMTIVEAQLKGRKLLGFATKVA